MSNFIDQKFVELYGTVVSGIREDVGQDLLVYSPGTSVACYNCLLDPILKRSGKIYSPANPYPSGVPGPTPFNRGGTCPVCRGVGYFSSDVQTSVKATVYAFKSGPREWQDMGIADNIAFRIKASERHYDILKTSRKIIVDGHECQVADIKRTGLGPQKINVVCLLKETSVESNPANN